MINKIKKFFNKQIEINLITFSLKALLTGFVVFNFISLKKEINYLKNSIELEKIRNEYLIKCLQFGCEVENDDIIF